MLRELSLIIIAGLVFPAFPQHSILARMPYLELGMHPMPQGALTWPWVM